MNQPAVAFPRAPHPSQASGPNPGAGLVASPFEPGGPGGPDDLGRSWLGRFLIALAACLAVGGGLPGCTDPPHIPDDIEAFYGELQDSARAFPQVDGAWSQHYGDAPFYGTAFNVRAGLRYGRADALALADASAENARSILRHAAKDPSYFLEDLEQVMMSALGLIEHAAARGEKAPPVEVEQIIDVINAFAVGLGRYVDLDAGQFAIKTYGPTAITAAVALLNLQYATYFPGEIADERTIEARRIVEVIDRRAHAPGKGYRVRPGEELLELYPNTMMMLVLCRLYERTGEVGYIEQAADVFEAIQPLKNRARGGYNSPYSAAAMGAKTDDYSTLSSQNYLTLALALLYIDTGDRRYFDEAIGVLRFIKDHLYDPAQRRVLHHFIDGRIAAPIDPEYFCTGCNFQLLYVVFYLKHHALGASAPGPAEPQSRNSLTPSLGSTPT